MGSGERTWPAAIVIAVGFPDQNTESLFFGENTSWGKPQKDAT